MNKPPFPIESDRGEAARKAVGYARVSTIAQKIDGLSLPAQKLAIQAYCRQHKLELLHIFADEGKSGSEITTRKGLLELMARAKEQKDFGRVVVQRLDRFGRSVLNVMLLQRELEKHDVQLCSISEPFLWENPNERLMLQVLSSFGEFERSLLTQRTLIGRLHKLQQGAYCGGRPGFAYRVENGSLLVNQNEAIIVKKIKELRGKGLSYRDIAKEIETLGFRTRKGGVFHHSSLRVICRSKLYDGWLRYGKLVRGNHQCIQ